jgi:hypothetical protein
MENEFKEIEKALNKNEYMKNHIKGLYETGKTDKIETNPTILAHIRDCLIDLGGKKHSLTGENRSFNMEYKGKRVQPIILKSLRKSWIIPEKVYHDIQMLRETNNTNNVLMLAIKVDSDGCLKPVAISGIDYSDIPNLKPSNFSNDPYYAGSLS